MLIMHIGFFSCFHAISLEHSRFSKIATLFSCPCSTEAVGIAHKPVACSARIVVDRQIHRTTTVTLAAHARQGLIIEYQLCSIIFFLSFRKVVMTGGH